MKTKIELKEFFDIKKCRDFVNEFSEKKNVIKREITPLVSGELVEYFVCLEYQEE